MKHVSENESVFNRVYEDLWPQVYNFIYYKVQNAQEAEELTQDVFNKVFNQLKTNNIDLKKIKKYIFVSARNTVYDLWRQKRNKPKIVRIDDLSEKGFELKDSYNDFEDNMIVHEALKELSSDEEQVLRLRIIEGYKIDEVSKIMKKPAGTIKSLQYRGLQKLKERLLKGGYFDE